MPQGFLTPESYSTEQAGRLESRRGELIIASCRSGTSLAAGVVQAYLNGLAEAGSAGEIHFLQDVDFDFSDSETNVRLERHVGGSDVYLFQALYDPVSGRTVGQNYLAFLIAARTFREHGAKHITGVLPYLAYARQDKPSKFQREPTTARLMADLSAAAGIDHMVCWHPHAGQIRGFYGRTSVHMLDPLNLFSSEFQRFQGRADTIVVAPDVGASKFVTHFSREIKVTSAIASKFRPQPEEARISEIIGDFRGKRQAIVLDDIISSAGTMLAVVRKLVEEKGIEEVYIGGSHNLCLEVGLARLLEMHDRYHLKELVVTDSVPQTGRFQALPFIRVCSLATFLCRTINRLHYDRSVSEIFLHE